ncbi:tetratricopeptide repeat protein [Microbulbifer sediminum]|uniref:tetratricopeptide repeat protein n=1 Tax=Microbulbifer sediminum TaxID=2904250 RepID=UPI001F1D59B7|nr:tetratricopeptide repeat protein [Microbulbifer sediminum]
MRFIISILLTGLATLAHGADDCRARTEAILAYGKSDADMLAGINRLPEQCTSDPFTRLKAAELYAATGKLNAGLQLLANEDDFGDYAEPAELLRARIYLAGGKPEVAKQVLREAMSAYPEKPGAATLYGEVLLSEGNSQEAYRSLLAALHAEPTARAYRGAAVAAYRMGDCQQAITALDQAMFMDEAGTLESWTAMLTGARCYTRQGKFRAATGALKAMVAADDTIQNRKSFKDTVIALRAAIRQAQESGDTNTDASEITLHEMDL